MSRLADESGKGAVSALVTLALLYLVAVFSFPFYNAWKDYMVVENNLKQAAQQCVTISNDDKRCHDWYDRQLAEHGLDFPKATDVQWIRLDANTIDLGFAYDERIEVVAFPTETKLYETKQSFRFHCKVTPGGCVNDAE